jgi:hypothetical protein
LVQVETALAVVITAAMVELVQVLVADGMAAAQAAMVI